MAIDFKPLREHLKKGVIKDLAEKNGLTKERGWLLLSGIIKNPKESDFAFIDDIISEATNRKKLIESRSERIKTLS